VIAGKLKGGLVYKLIQGDKMWNEWNTATQEAYREIFVRLGGFVPHLFGAVVIFLVGWLVAWLLQRLIDPVLRGILDPLWEVTRLEDLRKKSRAKMDITALLSRLVFWVVLAVVVLSSLQVLGMSGATTLFDMVIGYLPKVVAALIILVLGMILAHFLRETVKVTMSASELPYAGLLSGITYWAIVIFVASAALIQLGIAKDLLMVIFQGIVVALAISLGLAFGFGGQDWAKRVINNVSSEMKDKEGEAESEEEI